MDDIIYKIAQEYTLPFPIKDESVSGGFLTNNRKVTTPNASYFLKQHRYTDEHKLICITHLENVYQQHNIPIIKAIVNKYGIPYSNVEGKWYTLYPFINAKITERKNITTEHVQSMGTMLAKIHNAGEYANKSIFPSRNTDLKSEKFIVRYEQIKSILDNIKNKSEFDILTEKYLHIKREMQTTIPYFNENIVIDNDGIIHGDFQNYNMFFDKSGNITHIFDTEKPEFAPKYFEIIRSIDYTIFNTGYTDKNYQKAREYLHAYNTTIQIDANIWRNTLKAYIVSKTNNLWIVSEHYINSNHRADELLLPSLKSLEYLKDNHAAFIEELNIE